MVSLRSWLELPSWTQLLHAKMLQFFRPELTKRRDLKKGSRRARRSTASAACPGSFSVISFIWPWAMGQRSVFPHMVVFYETFWVFTGVRGFGPTGILLYLVLLSSRVGNSHDSHAKGGFNNSMTSLHHCCDDSFAMCRYYGSTIDDNW